MKKLLLILLLAFPIISYAQNINTIAGTDEMGYSGDGGPALEAQLNGPARIVSDAAGNVYFIESTGHRIRKVDASSGFISTVAGTGSYGFTEDGEVAKTAKLNTPWGLCLDAKGNIYFAEGESHRIRKIDISTGIIGTIAGKGTSWSKGKGFSGDGNTATDALLKSPGDVDIDGKGNIYFADAGNNRIRKVDVKTGIISTIAGNGTGGFSGDGAAAIDAEIRVGAMCVDTKGNVYFATAYRIRKVDISTGIITTIAGTDSWGYSGSGGLASEAKLSMCSDLDVDEQGNVYLVDRTNTVQKIDATTGIISTIAGQESKPGFTGDGSKAIDSQVNWPGGISVNSKGEIYISDTQNNRIRIIK